MWEDNQYCWVVLCKNNWFHLRKNLFFKHKIPLGEADAFSSCPVLDGPFTVRCDECGKEYLYKASEVSDSYLSYSLRVNKIDHKCHFLM
jgi:hypothetical protein